MANPEHLAILKQGVAEWNTWRKRRENATVTFDFTNADLHGVFLNGANLSRASLVAADLTDVLAFSCNFNEANLSNTNLAFSIFDSTDLSHADFRAARLHRTAGF